MTFLRGLRGDIVSKTDLTSLSVDKGGRTSPVSRLSRDLLPFCWGAPN
jgi:hypothetical protein